MKNELKQECLAKAKEIRANCYYMLDNAPLEMSNMNPILEVLGAAKRLIDLWEEDDEEQYDEE